MKNTSALYIDELKKALNHNHAAVLVGSGFSRNADDVNPMERHQMPNWYELADSFCEKLGMDVTNPETLKSSRYLDPLILAEKVEALHGRPFLDQLLISQMKDELHKPSEIHKKLLSLPWKDVFTTNYDTLLERTLPEITNKYRIVLEQNDLMYSHSDMLPRIVKLHGSFPSNRPFIITKEDFRKYPHDHAPFVNTVQQSLLENTFCLIGFSGDDPNFLSWISWINDNLGDNAPKIYMVIVKTKDKSKEKLFATKNVEYIVLQDVYGKDEKNDTYQDMLNAFFDDLIQQNEKYRKNRSVIKWPVFEKDFHYQEDDEESFLHSLRQIHESYPGYITVPYSCLLNVNYLLSKYSKMFWPQKKETSYELEILYEYCWTTNLVLRPLFDREIKYAESVLKRHKDSNNCQDRIKEILFAVLYAYRMNGNNNGWADTYEDLKEYCKDGYSRNCLIYEEIMFHLYNFELGKAEDLLEGFITSITYPDLLLKKGSLLAVFGRYEEAEGLLLENLSNIRRVALKNEDGDNRYRSLESCVIALYNHVKQAHQYSDKAFWNDQKEEYKQLNSIFEDAYNWKNENESFSLSMSDYYRRTENHTRKYSFDLGIQTDTYQFSDDDEAISAYQFIGFREKTGHPFKIGTVTNRKGVKGAALRVGFYNLKLPILLYYLSEEKGIVEDILTRPVLADFPREKVDELLSFCIASLREVLESKQGEYFGGWLEQDIRKYTIDTMPEIISRLMVKCSDSLYNDIYDLVLELYSRLPKYSVDGIRNLTTRFMENAPLKVILSKQDDLLRIPVQKSNENDYYYYPDPVVLLADRLKNKKYPILQTNEIINSVIRNLFKQYRDKEYAETVLTRLISLFLIYEFGEESRKRLKGLLWEDNDLDEYGLPIVKGFYYTVFFSLPRDVSEDDLYDRFWRKSQNEFKKSVDTEADNDTVEMIGLMITVIEKRGVSKDEVDELMPIILKACNNCINSTGILIGIGDDKNKRLKYLEQLVSILLLKSGYYSSRKHYTNDTLVEIKSILQDSDVPHVLLDWCMEKPKNRNTVIEDGLLSGINEKTHNTVDALYRLTRCDISVTERLIHHIIFALKVSNTLEADPYIRILEYLARQKMLSRTNCDDVSDIIRKYDSITKIGYADYDENSVWGRKLIMRTHIAMLACALNDYYLELGNDIPDGVTYWKNIAGCCEEFVEIRRTWE